MAHKEYGVTDILDVYDATMLRTALSRSSVPPAWPRTPCATTCALLQNTAFTPTWQMDSCPTSQQRYPARYKVFPRRTPPSLPAAPLFPYRDLISDWLEKDGLTLTKVHIKLGRMV